MFLCFDVQEIFRVLVGTQIYVAIFAIDGDVYSRQGMVLQLRLTPIRSQLN